MKNNFCQIIYDIINCSCLRYGILPPSLQDENGMAKKDNVDKKKKEDRPTAPIENEQKLMDEIKK